MSDHYSIPSSITDHIEGLGYKLPYGEMQGYIESWHAWGKATGAFYDWVGKDSTGKRRSRHRRSAKPAERVCEEWASLLMNDKTTISTGDEKASEWLQSFLKGIDFKAKGQGLVQDAFETGTGAWAVWLDLGAKRMQLRRYDARMILPMSWDDDGVTECAFCSRANVKGKRVDQVQIHMLGENGTYHILTAMFGEDGKEIHDDGVEADFDTKCPTPTFALVRPAIGNRFVDLSPYGQSIFASALDMIQSVDLCFDSIFTEVELSKMRIFMSDTLLQPGLDENGNRKVAPFGDEDDLAFRKVMSVDDMIEVFAPPLRTEAQVRAYRMAWQSLGDKCGFGPDYFDIDQRGGLKTATEVSSDNSALMRNIRKHENALEGAIVQICHAVCHCGREFLDAGIGDEGEITVQFDDSIIQDTAAEKAQDQSEIGVTLNAWEYRKKWYGEDEETAKANVPQAVSDTGGWFGE